MVIVCLLSSLLCWEQLVSLLCDSGASDSPSCSVLHAVLVADNVSSG